MIDSRTHAMLKAMFGVTTSVGVISLDCGQADEEGIMGQVDRNTAMFTRSFKGVRKVYFEGSRENLALVWEVIAFPTEESMAGYLKAYPGDIRFIFNDFD